MKTLNFTVTPTSPVWTFNNRVRTIRYDNATGVSTRILVQETSGNMLNVEMSPGDLIRLDEGDYAQGIAVTAVGGGTISGEITVGAGLMSSNNIVGAVNIIDGSYPSTMNDENFTAVVNVGAVAGQMPHAQLFNSGSKNLILSGIAASTSANGYVAAYHHGATIGAASATQPWSNRSGLVAATSAQTRQANSAALLPALANNFNNIFLQANGGKEYNYVKPIVITPGRSVILVGASGNDMAAIFDFSERNP